MNLCQLPALPLEWMTGLRDQFGSRERLKGNSEKATPDKAYWNGESKGLKTLEKILTRIPNPLQGPSFGGRPFHGCWETFYVFAYCGKVVEIQPLNCIFVSIVAPLPTLTKLIFPICGSQRFTTSPKLRSWTRS